MTQKTISKQDYFSISFVLSRVLNTGIIMSIEKNEQELKGFEKILKRLSGKKYASLFNSYTGAIHGATNGKNIVYGDKIGPFDPNEKTKKFIKWLGLIEDPNQPEPFKVIKINWENISDISEMLKNFSKSETIVVDFTDLSFGPCAAVLTNDEMCLKKCERLKIFGAFDLRTMWTQKEEEKDIQAGVQFNYRLSPLVGACVKLSIVRSGK